MSEVAEGEWRHAHTRNFLLTHADGSAELAQFYVNNYGEVTITEELLSGMLVDLGYVESLP